MAPSSEVWKYFTKCSSSQASCKMCLKKVRFCGNTSNLHKHMKVHDIHTSKNNVEEDNEKPKPQCSEIKTMFENMNMYKEGNSKHEKITMALIYFICKDMRPIQVVEGKGFLKLMRLTALLYKVPSRTTITSQIVEKFNAVSLVYKKRLENVSEFCITADEWSETMAEKSYLGVTANFLEGIQRIDIVLATRELNEKHTAIYLAKTMSDIFEEWHILPEKIRCIVTDNGANMTAAAKMIINEKNCLPCFAHTINLVVQNGLKQEAVKSLIVKVREIVKFIKKSVRRSDILRNLQKRNGIPEGSLKKLILDVSTRWNSVYYMLERFLEMLPLCSEIIFKETGTCPEMISSSEIEIIKPLEYMSRDSCAENYVTISKLIPMISCLKTKLSEFSSNLPLLTLLKEKLECEINKRFGTIEHNSHAAIATLLDPRFKNIHFQDAGACGRAIQKLKLLVNDSNSIDSQSESDDSVQNYYDFWSSHKKMAATQKLTKNEKDIVSIYLSSNLSSLKSSPLEEWEENKSIFPGLYKQARSFLLPVASSVPCERLFSKAGSTITKNRYRLLGKHLERLLFLGNIPEYEFFN